MSMLTTIQKNIIYGRIYDILNRKTDKKAVYDFLDGYIYDDDKCESYNDLCNEAVNDYMQRYNKIGF